MKDYSAMSDFEINKEVAYFKIGGDWLLEPTDERKFTFYNLDVETKNTVELPDYCNNPADAWPIIYGNLITIEADYEFIDESEAEVFPTGLWIAERSGNHEFLQHVNESPLRAAMIVYLQMMDGGK